MRILTEEDEEPTIAMAPLIDVVFLLIIFFLVATSFYRPKPEQDLDVQLPKATEGEERPDPSPDIIINVRQSGVFVVEGRVLSIQELSQLLVDAVAKDPEQGVIVRGDRRAIYDNVVSVFDACARAGIESLSIATLSVPDEGNP